MVAITNPGTKVTEFAGEYKLVSMYNLALTTASETMTLSFTNNGMAEIQNVMVCINGGQDAAFTDVSASFSDLVITIVSKEEDGSAATDWTGATVNLIVIGK